MTPNGKSNQLNVLIFKDDLASRAFQVPMRWLTQVGVLLGGLVLLLIFVSILTVRYRREAQMGNPEIVGQLHAQIDSLKEENEALQAKLPPKLVDTQPDSEFTAKPVPALGPYVFMNLPRESLSPKVNPSPPIKMEKLSAQWDRRTLIVRYNIVYTANDGRNQQGRIFMMAQGKDHLYVYPKEAMQTLGRTYSVSPMKGEYFSVGRFRGVRANFGPVEQRQELTQLQVFLFDKKGNILIHQDVDLSTLFTEKEKQDAGQ